MIRFQDATGQSVIDALCVEDGQEAPNIKGPFAIYFGQPGRRITRKKKTVGRF